MKVNVLRDVMEANECVARENRRVFDDKGILVINVMSSPGAGKTALLERTLEALKNEFSMAVIEGDIATQLDAERIQRHGVPALQINTQGGCHLDANMIHNALERLSLEGVRILFIENVGNLVCPAEFALGEDMKVTILSVAEGDDKPEKYPVMFQQSRALVINKVDLLGFVDFDMEVARKRSLSLNPRLTIFELSCRTGLGFEAWVNWLREQVSAKGCEGACS